ncbi:hypothetical protein NUSPORA_01870 [Nucleospora cyclopteri]
MHNPPLEINIEYSLGCRNEIKNKYLLNFISVNKLPLQNVIETKKMLKRLIL